MSRMSMFKSSYVDLDIELELQDILNKSNYLSGSINITDDQINLRFAGYGDTESIVAIEIRDGIPHVLTWANIDAEEPTHVISLEGAREKRRN